MIMNTLNTKSSINQTRRRPLKIIAPLSPRGPFRKAHLHKKLLAVGEIVSCHAWNVRCYMTEIVLSVCSWQVTTIKYGLYISIWSVLVSSTWHVEGQYSGYYCGFILNRKMKWHICIYKEYIFNIIIKTTHSIDCLKVTIVSEMFSNVSESFLSELYKIEDKKCD